MKTAKEWISHFSNIEEHDCACICERCKNGTETFLIPSDITQIQRDAFSAGMKVAAEMIECQSILSDFSLSHPNGGYMMAQKIYNNIEEGFDYLTR